jgi:hypothetical protein
MKHHANGTVTLTSFAELGAVLDTRSLSEAPADVSSLEPAPELPPTLRHGVDLADLVAQLAGISDDLEAVAREDARARERATIDLARYEALLAERQAGEQALAEARRVRAAAEKFAAEAFSEDARLDAPRRVATARPVELRCTELLAERTRKIEELASGPYLARVLAERQRVADEQRDHARRVETERAERISTVLAAVDHALGRDDLDDAHRLIDPLTRQFPNDADVRRKVDIVQWRLRNWLTAPAEAALRDVSRRPLRNDAEAALARLAELRTSGLPNDLARRVFGLWSNASYRVVQQRGWHEPRREAPHTSRGAVWARPEPGGPYEVVSSLDDPNWRPGQLVPEPIACKAPLMNAGPHRDLAYSH